MAMTFIVDDTAAAIKVCGAEGNDNFLIGRVLKTKTVMVDGEEVQVIDDTDADGDGEIDGITAGVRYNGIFYGGRGDDYFEVNRNIGTLDLFGESGDDTFFLKAHRVVSPEGKDSELEGGDVATGAGGEDGSTNEKDKDVLLSYIQNNRVSIVGGSGFDTIVIAGTATDDEFYIYIDNEGRQYLYGAGIKLDNVDGIERLALVAGAGDDKIWLYGLKEGLSLLLNLGSGNDVIYLGESQEFSVTYPASSAAYTVSQQVLQEIVDSTETVTDNINLVRRDSLYKDSVDPSADRKRAFREFYKKWFPNGASSGKLILAMSTGICWKPTLRFLLMFMEVIQNVYEPDFLPYTPAKFEAYLVNSNTIMLS